ncbi:3\'-Phosphoadenosine 5\'-phosphosulfate (PAPS) 3\'-phosphatase [gamma proteobacterium HdN1]|nr:3\'-Phosphoadenosine 5\'-phosphosulfate (PAPS) 3\'-phosphatase [gamma proteobacterium HdN1]
MLEEVIQIARRAGEAILEVYHASGAVEVQHKDDNSPLTIADERSNRVIVESLRALNLPMPVPLVSEECPLPALSERKQWPRFWLIDPLDGTKEFIKRNDEFTVNIALVEGGVPVLGVVVAPALNTTWAGAMAYGAFRECHAARQGRIERVEIAPRKLSRDSITVLGSRSHGVESMDALLAGLQAQFKSVQIENVGSSLKFCRVAEGSADLYPRLTPVCEWDAAAAHAVLRAAGGDVFSPTRAAPMAESLRYRLDDGLLVPQFLAVGDLEAPWNQLLANCFGVSK